MDQFEPTAAQKSEGTRLLMELNEVCNQFGREPCTFAALVTCGSLHIVAGLGEDRYAAECQESYGDAQRPGGPKPGASTIAAAFRMEDEELALTREATDAIVQLALRYSTFVFFHATLVYAATLSLEAGDSEDGFTYLARQAYRVAEKQFREHRQPVARA
jgi:hypothetical protein